MNTEPRKPARILLVDDDPILRHGVRALLANLTDLAVCAEADSTQDALHSVSTLRPDLVIVDLSLGGEDVLRLIRRLRTLDARLPVVVFSMREEARFAVLALMAGARGYVRKHDSPSMLIREIREALKTTGESPAPETR